MSLELQDNGRAEFIATYLLSKPRILLIPFLSFTTGFFIGVRKGARISSLRFLAENAHRAPRTLKGWYFYNKTKNYRIMWGALKGGGNYGAKVATVGSVWVALEEGCAQFEAVNEVREVIAGAGCATVFLGFARLPWVVARRVLAMGTGAGALLAGLRRLEPLVENWRRK